MSTPPEEPRPNPFSVPMAGPQPNDGSPSGQPWNPAPPPMSSPYGAPLSGNESNSGNSAPRQPLRFPPPQPEPSWGSSQTPPPFVPPTDTSGTGATIPPAAPTGSGWGNRNETFFLPPQFSYNPDQPLAFAPPLPPAKRKRKTLAIAAISAIVVLAAGVGGAVILTSHGDSDKPAATIGGPMASDSRTSSTPSPKSDPRLAWSAKDNLAPAAKTTIGSWLVDSHTVVRGDPTGLQAYDAETGNALWTWAVPGQGAKACDISQSAEHKIGVVQYGPDGNCTTVAAIDTDSGKPIWSTQIPGGTTTPAISQTDDLVAGAAGDVLTVWNAADGKKLWDVDLSKANPSCRLFKAALRTTSAAILANCGKGTTVLMKDAHTGADRWQTPLPADAPNAHRTLVSAGSPTIVHVEATPQGAAPVDVYFAFSDTGQLQATINGIGAFGKLEPLVGPSGLQHQVAHVSGNVLVEPTAAKNPAAGLVAFDLTTGKQLWQAPAVTGDPVAVVALDQDKTLVFDGGVTETGPGARLLAYSTANGAPATSPIKDALGQDWAGPAAAYLVGDRLVVVPAWPRKGAAVVAFQVKQ